MLRDTLRIISLSFNYYGGDIVEELYIDKGGNVNYGILQFS
jgi:hypothetical protein